LITRNPAGNRAKSTLSVMHRYADFDESLARRERLFAKARPSTTCGKIFAKANRVPDCARALEYRFCYTVSVNTNR
jgi:hypothetical protein